MPAEIVIPPVRVDSLPVFDSVSVPLPVLTIPLLPVMAPLKVVLELLPPVVSVLAPSVVVPAPASEPMVSAADNTRKAPDATLTALALPMASPFWASIVPAEMVVAPVLLLLPERVSVPAPVLVMPPPVPLILPL